MSKSIIFRVCSVCGKTHEQRIVFKKVDDNSMKPRYLCKKECVLELLIKSRIKNYSLNGITPEEQQWIIEEINKNPIKKDDEDD
jgi:hypothetical protein